MPSPDVALSAKPEGGVAQVLCVVVDQVQLPLLIGSNMMLCLLKINHVLQEMMQLQRANTLQTQPSTPLQLQSLEMIHPDLLSLARDQEFQAGTCQLI